VNKYRAKPTEYKGRRFDSKMEMEYYRNVLEPLEQATSGMVVLPQIPVWLARTFRYVPDFLVFGATDYFDHNLLFVDVKGAETTRFRDTCNLWTQWGKAPLYVIKRKGKSFVVDRIVEGAE
jgi:hypothetical protein